MHTYGIILHVSATRERGDTLNPVFAVFSHSAYWSLSLRSAEQEKFNGKRKSGSSPPALLPTHAAGTVLYCTVPKRTVLYCTVVLYCIGNIKIKNKFLVSSKRNIYEYN